MNRFLMILATLTITTGIIAAYMVWGTVPAHASFDYQCEVTPSVTPEVTPEITPEVTEEPTPGQPGLSSNFSDPQSPAVCSGSEIKYAPTVVEFKRVDADSVWVRWTKVDDHISDYVVEYGLGPIPMWKTIVHGNDTTLNYLPKWLPIWVRVAGTDNCVVGQFGEWIDP